MTQTADCVSEKHKHRYVTSYKKDEEAHWKKPSMSPGWMTLREAVELPCARKARRES